VLSKITKTAEDTTGLKFYHQQVRREYNAGLLTQKQAEDLFQKIERVRGYASLQVILIAQAIITRTLPFLLPLWARLFAPNLTISLWPLLDKRTSFAHLHSPGILLLRCIPGCSIMAANITILRAEPDLHDIALRFCERTYSRYHLGFLNPIFVRPSMKIIRWLCQLNWPQTQ